MNDNGCETCRAALAEVARLRSLLARLHAVLSDALAASEAAQQATEEQQP